MSTNFRRQRRFPRRYFNRNVAVLVKGQHFLCGSGEIGEGGMQVSGELKLDLGQVLLVSFIMNHEHFVSVRAEVRNQHRRSSGGKGFGLMFLNLPLSVKRLIRNYVAAKSDSEIRKEEQQMQMLQGNLNKVS